MIARRQPCATLALLVAGLALAGPAWARDMTGKAGVGVLSSLDGVPHLAVRYWRTDVSAELLAGWSSHAVTSQPLDAPTAPNETDVRISIGLLWRIGDQPRATLSVGVRPWFTYHALSQPALLESQGGIAQWGVELPVQAEFFVSDNFGISGAIGPSLLAGASPVAAHTTLGAHATATSWSVALTGGYSGGLGFTYYL
jgi:hypothetical protein